MLLNQGAYSKKNQETNVVRSINKSVDLLVLGLVEKEERQTLRQTIGLRPFSQNINKLLLLTSRVASIFSAFTVKVT